MPGIMLETQNNNVAACKFYEKCGFVIGGFDFLVYKGLIRQVMKLQFIGIYISNDNSL